MHMDDDYVLLKVPKAADQRLAMSLMVLRIGFDTAETIDGKLVMFDYATGIAHKLADGTPGSMAIVVTGQNIKHRGELAWCCLTGPAYAKGAAT